MIRQLVLSFTCFVCASGIAMAQLPVTDGLQLWLDATDDTTVFDGGQKPGDGDFVDSWLDKSGNDYEAIVPDIAGIPTYTTDGINGLPSVRFTGEFADGMIIDEFSLERPYTAFVVNQYWGSDFRGRTLQSQDINWLLGLWAGRFGHYAEGWVNSPQPDADIERPYVVDAIGTETESFLAVNGTDWTTNSSPVGVPGGLAIAGAGSFPGEVSDADVSEIIIYDRVLSDNELASVRTHLFEKYETTPVDPPPPPPELIVHKGTVGTFANAEELDFSGDFVYAVNTGGPGENDFGDALTIGDAEFFDGTNAAEQDLNDEGIAVTVANEILNWHAPNYGDTEDDDNLELVMQSIRWNVPPGVDIALEVEEGESYKLQLLFAESCCDRGFDIFMEEEEVVTDLVVQTEQGGINNQETGVVYSREFVAGDEELNITLGGSVGVPDNNPILNGFTLEKIDDIMMLVGDCNGDGVLNAEDLTCVSTLEERDAVLTALNTLPGDLDGVDGVGFTDFITLSSNYPDMTKLSYAEGNVDLSDDGVAFADFIELSNNYGQGGAAAVPEPTGLATVSWVIAALFAVCRRRRRVR